MKAHKYTDTAVALVDARLGLYTQRYRADPRDPVHGRANPSAWSRRRARREWVEMGRLQLILNRDLARAGYTTVQAHCTRTCDPTTGRRSLVITHTQKESDDNQS